MAANQSITNPEEAYFNYFDDCQYYDLNSFYNYIDTNTPKSINIVQHLCFWRSMAGNIIFNSIWNDHRNTTSEFQNTFYKPNTLALGINRKVK